MKLQVFSTWYHIDLFVEYCLIGKSMGSKTSISNVLLSLLLSVYIHWCIIDMWFILRFYQSEAICIMQSCRPQVIIHTICFCWTILFKYQVEVGHCCSEMSCQTFSIMECHLFYLGSTFLSLINVSSCYHSPHITPCRADIHCWGKYTHALCKCPL